MRERRRKSASIDCVSLHDFIVRVILLVPGMSVARVRKFDGEEALKAI